MGVSVLVLRVQPYLLVARPSGCLEVKAQDEEAENQEVYDREAQANCQRHKICLTMCGGEGHKVKRGHLDEAAREDAHHAKSVHRHGEAGGKRRVGHKELGRHKEERVLDGLGHATEHRGQRHGDEKRQHALAALGLGGNVERGGDARNAKEL